MFNFVRKNRNDTGALNASQTPARFILNESGMIIHANDAFLKTADISRTDIGKRHMNSVFNFANGDTALQSLPGGMHDIRLQGASGSGKAMPFQCDWVVSRNGAPLLVAAQVIEDADYNDTETRNFIETFEKRPLTLNMTSDAHAKPRPRQRRKSDLIPDLQPFFSLSGDIMIVTHDDGTIIQTNRKFTRLFGDTDSVQSFFDIFKQDSQTYARGALQALALSRTNPKILSASNQAHIVDFEAENVLQNGTVKSTAWRGHKTGAYYYFLGQDLTALKNQKAALNDREKQLTQAESVGRMGHWRWVVGEEKMNWSDQIYTMFGVEKDSFVPSLSSMRTLMPEDDRERIDRAFQRAIIEQNDYDMEFSITRADGEDRFIRAEGRCALNEDGEVTSLYGIMQDMTERTKYERDLRMAKDAAERSYAAKTQFLANMSHELRTPLNAIIGFSDLMINEMMGPLGHEKYKEYVEGIQNSGKHLLDLISDILDMSKIEAGKYELDLEELNVHDLINACLTMVHGRTEESGIALKVVPMQNTNLTIVADRRAMMQILLNVISNAVKFTKTGGSVSVKCTPDGDMVAFEVKDTGIGIPANKLANITRPFEQVSSDYAKLHEGSGLGLAITKDLIDLHGGALDIQSTVDVGTTVTITLPVSSHTAA